MDLSVYASLFINPSLDVENSKKLRKIFDQFDFENNEIDEIETEIARNISDLSGYYVILWYSLNRQPAPSQSFSNNLKEFSDQINSYKDGNGNKKYLLEIDDSHRYSANFSDSKIPEENTISCTNFDSPQDEIKAMENAIHKECEGLEITDHRIGTAYQYYEWKIDMEIRPIKIGRCQIMKTKIPVLKHRITKVALWCYAMTQPQIKNNFEKAIRACIEDAAISTGALAIATGGLGLAAAAQAFVSAFFDCFEKKISDSVRCIVGSLKLVTETPKEWKEGAF